MWSEFVHGLSSTNLVFFICALAGTLFFLIRTVWMFIGGLGDIGGDAGHDAGGAHDAGGDAGQDAAGHAHDAGAAKASHTSDSAFKLFSVQGMTAFVMMFGWSGLAASLQYGLSPGAAAGVAFVCGSIAMAIVGLLFAGALKLVSPGHRFRVEDTVGKVASVYLRIPADGKGRVQVTLNGMTHELDAVSETHEELASFTNVRVVRVIDNQTVAVSKTL